MPTCAKGGPSPHERLGPGPGRSWVRTAGRGHDSHPHSGLLLLPGAAGCDWPAYLLGGLDARAGVTAPARSRGQAARVLAPTPLTLPCVPAKLRALPPGSALLRSVFLAAAIRVGLGQPWVSCQSRGGCGVRCGPSSAPLPRLRTHRPAAAEKAFSSRLILPQLSQPCRLALPSGSFWTLPRGLCPRCTVIMVQPSLWPSQSQLRSPAYPGEGAHYPFS